MLYLVSSPSNFLNLLSLLRIKHNIAQWIGVRLPSMLLSFIVIFMFCIVKRTKINKIEPEFGPLPKLLPQLYVDYVVNTDPSFDIKISITGQNLTQWRTRRWDRLNCLRSTHDSHSFDVQSSNQSVNSRIFLKSKFPPWRLRRRRRRRYGSRWPSC